MSFEFPCGPLDGISSLDKGGARPSPILRSWYTSDMVGVSSRLRRRNCVAMIWSCMLLGPLLEAKPPPLGLLDEITSGASSNDFDSGADMSLPPPLSEGKKCSLESLASSLGFSAIGFLEPAPPRVGSSVRILSLSTTDGWILDVPVLPLPLPLLPLLLPPPPPLLLLLLPPLDNFKVAVLWNVANVPPRLDLYDDFTGGQLLPKSESELWDSNPPPAAVRLVTVLYSPAGGRGCKESTIGGGNGGAGAWRGGGRGGSGWLMWDCICPARRSTVAWPLPSQSVAELALLDESGRRWYADKPPKKHHV